MEGVRMKGNFVRLFLFSALVFLALGSVLAASTVRKGSSPPPADPLDLDQVFHEVNRVELLMTNWGIIGQDVMTGTGAGFWPYGSGDTYVFGTGLWIGGIADVNNDGTTDTVTALAYAPSEGLSEHAEGRFGQESSDPLARIFDSRDPTDLAEWPPEFRFPGGDPIVLSQQDLVTIYNDDSGTPAGAFALGVQVNQRSMAFSGKVAGTSVDAIYFVWTIVNISDSLPTGPYTIEGMHVGYCADVDLGPSSTEDKTSFIPYVVEESDTVLLNTAVAWDANLSETGFTGQPGILGFSFDETQVPGSIVHFTFMSNPGITAPRPDPEASEDEAQFRILSCLGGECEEHDLATDIRFVLSMGPVDLAPGETQRIRGVLFFASPFAEPTALLMTGEPPRIDPYQEGMANFIVVAKEVKRALTDGAAPSPFDIFRVSLHEDTTDSLGPYTIHAGITDSTGLETATLHYSTDGGGTFTPVAMTLSPTVLFNYTGDIPGQPWNSTVLYYVEAMDSAGVTLTDPATAPDSVYSFDIVEGSGIDGDEPQGPGTPRAMALAQNYPNPFNPTTMITFTMPGAAGEKKHAAVEIFDTRGKRVRTLFEGELEPGTHAMSWNGRTSSGESTGSGIYLYRLSVDGESVSRKMVLLK
jgi:hypothetical protein